MSTDTLLEVSSRLERTPRRLICQRRGSSRWKLEIVGDTVQIADGYPDTLRRSPGNVLSEDLEIHAQRLLSAFTPFAFAAPQRRVDGNAIPDLPSFHSGVSPTGRGG
jgi:hypothetical protein